MTTVALMANGKYTIKLAPRLVEVALLSAGGTECESLGRKSQVAVKQDAFPPTVRSAAERPIARSAEADKGREFLGLASQASECHRFAIPDARHFKSAASGRKVCSSGMLCRAICLVFGESWRPRLHRVFSSKPGAKGARMLAFLALMCTILCLCPRGQAEEILAPRQAAMRLPDDATASRGFTVDVEIAYHDIAGYVPLECTITSTSRFAADRDFVLRLQPLPGARTPPRNGMVIEVPLHVAEGSKSVTVNRYLPKWSAGHSYRVAMFEAGQPLAAYEGSIGNPVLQGGNRARDVLANEYRADWVVIDVKDRVTLTDAARIRRQLTPLTDQFQSPRTPRTPRGTFGGVALTPVGQDELPQDWRGYQRYDLVIVTEESLQELSTHPEELETLRQWVLTGGAVLGFDVASAEQFAGRLGFSWTDRAESRGFVVKQAAAIIGQREQPRTLLRNRRDELESYLSKAESNTPIVPGTAGAFEDFNNVPTSLKALRDEIAKIARQQLGDDRLREQNPWLKLTASEWADRVWLQSAGAGMIIGLKGDEGVISEMHWQIVAPKLANQVSPTLRRGVDPLLGDSRFSQWVIPGVAQPPVYTFMGLLTAFVILVGPISYRKTTRYGRGYLMFAIAPLLAMVTTLAMFGYGIVADGFGTIARVRQLTWIDGTSGDGGQRIRSTYFAGVRPGSGLQFPAQAEVIGYPDSSGVSWEESDELAPAIVGKVWVSDERQLFDSAFLPSRQQRQFVVHQPQPGIGTVALQSRAGAAPQLTSTLDFPLIRVVARDAEGNYWSASDLLPGQPVAGVQLSGQEPSKELGDMYNQYRPLSAVREAKQRDDYGRRTRDLQVNINRAIGETSSLLIDGNFEKWLRDQLQLRGGLPLNHFVAIAAVNDDVLVVKDAELVESVHYVFGTMP